MKIIIIISLLASLYFWHIYGQMVETNETVERIEYNQTDLYKYKQTLNEKD